MFTISTFDLINIIAYPILAYICWKGGWARGAEDTIDFLHSRGVVDKDNLEEMFEE
jgi:ammonia channel protein AmtB